MCSVRHSPRPAHRTGVPGPNCHPCRHRPGPGGRRTESAWDSSRCAAHQIIVGRIARTLEVLHNRGRHHRHLAQEHLTGEAVVEITSPSPTTCRPVTSTSSSAAPHTTPADQDWTSPTDWRPLPPSRSAMSCGLGEVVNEFAHTTPPDSCRRLSGRARSIDPGRPETVPARLAQCPKPKVSAPASLVSCHMGRWMGPTRFRLDCLQWGSETAPEEVARRRRAR
jgi:hypothetical protein